MTKKLKVGNLKLENENTKLKSHPDEAQPRATPKRQHEAWPTAPARLKGLCSCLAVSRKWVFCFASFLRQVDLS